MIIFELMGMTNYIKIFNEFLKKEIDYNNPKNMYDQVKYILDSGGKRLRPLITLFVSAHFTENIINALPASAASSIDKLTNHSDWKLSQSTGVVLKKALTSIEK